MNILKLLCISAIVTSAVSGDPFKEARDGMGVCSKAMATFGELHPAAKTLSSTFSLISTLCGFAVDSDTEMKETLANLTTDVAELKLSVKQLAVQINEQSAKIIGEMKNLIGREWCERKSEELDNKIDYIGAYVKSLEQLQSRIDIVLHGAGGTKCIIDDDHAVDAYAEKVIIQRLAMNDVHFETVLRTMNQSKMDMSMMFRIRDTGKLLVDVSESKATSEMTIQTVGGTQRLLYPQRRRDDRQGQYVGAYLTTDKNTSSYSTPRLQVNLLDESLHCISLRTIFNVWLCSYRRDGSIVPIARMELGNERFDVITNDDGTYSFRTFHNTIVAFDAATDRIGHHAVDDIWTHQTKRNERFALTVHKVPSHPFDVRMLEFIKFMKFVSFATYSPTLQHLDSYFYIDPNTEKVRAISAFVSFRDNGFEVVTRDIYPGLIGLYSAEWDLYLSAYNGHLREEFQPMKVIFNEKNSMIQLRALGAQEVLHVDVSDGSQTDEFRVIYTDSNYEDLTKLHRVQFALKAIYYPSSEQYLQRNHVPKEWGEFPKLWVESDNLSRYEVFRFYMKDLGNGRLRCTFTEHHGECIHFVYRGTTSWRTDTGNPTWFQMISSGKAKDRYVSFKHIREERDTRYLSMNDDGCAPAERDWAWEHWRLILEPYKWSTPSNSDAIARRISTL